MKTCTKCKKELLESEFTKHSQKKDKLNSWCRACEKIEKGKSLLRNPLCSMCHVSPHMDGDRLCYPCSRKSKGRGEPSCRRRKDLGGKCPRCETRYRNEGQPYCPPCKLDYQNEKRAKKWHERYVGNEAKRIETNRGYATNLLARGKIRRGSCVFCGAPGTQFHHYDYERKTRNFEDVCDGCHGKVHSFLQFAVDSFIKHGVKVV